MNIEQFSDKKLNQIASEIFYNTRANTGFDPCSNWNECGELLDEMHSCGSGSVSLFSANGSAGYIFTSNAVNYSTTELDLKRAVTIIYILFNQE